MAACDCEQPHIGEEIGTPDPGEATDIGCREAVGAYVGRPFRNLEDEMGVNRLLGVTKGEVGWPRCELYVSSSQLLTDTVRRLGNANLPR